MSYAFRTRPLTAETWPQLEELFEVRGNAVVRGCYCMHFRAASPEPGAKAGLRALVDGDGVTPGLIGYVDDEPAGWISLGPRPDYRRLERSRVMKQVDDTPVWSVICTFVARTFRRRGVQHRLVAAAVEHARQHGAGMLEAYPVDKPERSHPDSLFVGSRSLFERAGFTEVVRRSPTRVTMRLDLS
ncbi:GNAT family N-acetyltransferase [Jiangella endophytica]|uniref:GNAT family N-acetyltransferase n=1 Tax=Jiangella endophytica TaxID=1623398 RepID=UPI000E345B75|nr:GNAT family N-acetyltransferase [Jiangella endophytica]